MLFELAPALGNRNPTLQQDRPQLVEQRCALAHQTIPNPVQCLHVELFFSLELDETHGGPRRRFGDRLRITVIILLSLDVGADILGRHQSNLVALCSQDPTEMVSATTRFHCNDARCQTAGKVDDTRPLHTPTNDNASVIIESDDAAAVLTQVDPKNRNLHGTAPLLRLPSERTAAGGGAGHSISMIGDGGDDA